MTAFTQVTPSRQRDVDSSVPFNPLDFGVEIAKRSEVQAFLDAIPEPPHVTEARFEIIQAYESGAIGAVEAFNALEAHGCLTDADEVMRYFVSGYRASMGVPPAPPVESPQSHPTAPKPHRAASPAKELLDAVAGARMSRRVA
jgi:hypothetical protein